NRFAPYYRELHLECAGDRFPPAVTSPPAVSIAERTDPGQSILEATQEGQEVGVCVYSTLAGLSDDPQAAPWGYIHWLHVAPEQRRHGLARYLLTAALDRLYREGCSGCWLTTGADNWPAQPLYLSLGFEIVDASASFRKELSDG